MKFTDVRFSAPSLRKEFGENGNCGICSVSVEAGKYSFVVHGIKVKKVHGLYKVFLPERRVGGVNRYKPVITSTDFKFKDNLTLAVLDAYFDAISRLS